MSLNTVRPIPPKNQGYFVDSLTAKYGIKFPKAKRVLSEAYARSDQPSPNQYKYQSYEKSRTNPKFSFGREQKFFKTRKQMKLKTQIPGPGVYEQNWPNNKMALLIPHSERFDLQISKQVPGVGLYCIQKDYFKHKTNVKFNRQRTRSITNKSMAPGPNKYFFQQTDTRYHNQTFNKERKMHFKLNNFPGVGQYSIQNFTTKHSPCAKFPLSHRNSGVQKTDPGSGNYQSYLIQRYKLKSKFGSVIFEKARKQKDQKQFMPSPGKYNICQKRKELKGGLLSNRNFDQYLKIFPEPVNQESKLVLVAQKPISSGIDTKQRGMRKKQLNQPGSINCHIQKAKIHFNSTGFTLPISKQQLF